MLLSTSNVRSRSARRPSAEGYAFSVELWITPDWGLTRCTERQVSINSGIVFDEMSCEGRDASDIPRRRL
jgi:hypothetical protein